MNFKKSLSIFMIAMLGVFIFSSCDSNENVENTNGMTPATKSIVETATSANDFSILVDALVKADLVAALDGPGPYTVFAPSNEAFQTLFNQLGVDGIEDLSAEALTPILLNHVVSGSVQSYDLNTGYVETLNSFTPDQLGADIYVQVAGTKSSITDDDKLELISNKLAQNVMVNGSTSVIIADIMASNGIIHKIDEVILPSNIVDFAITNPAFSILVEAVVKAELVEALSSEGPFTVFAPTTAAFEELFTALGVSGINDIPAETLKPILLYHVIGDNVIAEEVGKGSVPTLNTSSSIMIDIQGSMVTLNGSSRVVATDVQGSNGVIHVIDEVLLPQ